MSDVDIQLAEEVMKYYDDPYGYVMFAYQWGEPGTRLEGFEGPDIWQREALIAIGDAVKDRGFDGFNAVDPIQMAIASGHGIGKTCFTAWVVDWIMSTRPYCRGRLTANTGDQVRTVTMAEIAKWNSLSITGHWFVVNAMSVHHRAYPDTWRLDALTCREENSEAFAGLHAASSTPFYIFDEASAIPEKIWEVASGGLTDGEPMHFCFGNPTRNHGSFYECFRKNSHRWITKQIDSRNTKTANKKYLQRIVDDYGEDSDRTRVRVKGQFPRAGDIQFIPSDVVYDAMRKGAGQYIPDEPLICGIDMARGGDDNCMIVFRRGKDGKSEKVYKITGEKSKDSMKVISMLVMILDRHKPDVTFMDKGSMGGPCADRLRQLGYHVIDVGFGDNAIDHKHFKSRTAEMGSNCRQWLLDGGCIPNDPQLELELTAREFGHNDKDQLVLERKKDMKKRIKVSPDWADALYLTFAEPVPLRDTPRGHLDASPYERGKKDRGDYNPLDSMDSGEYT